MFLMKTSTSNWLEADFYPKYKNQVSKTENIVLIKCASHGSYYSLWGKPLLKPLYTFGTEQEITIHRFTNNLQGLQKVMVKDFS